MARQHAIYFGENWWKSVERRQIYLTVFFCFSRWNLFQLKKLRPSCAATSVHAAHFLLNTTTLVKNSKQFSNWLISFRENWLYVFYPPGKGGKGSKIVPKKISTCIVPQTVLRIRLNIAIGPTRLRDPLAQPFKKRETGENKIRYRVVKNMADIFYRKPPFTDN